MDDDLWFELVGGRAMHLCYPDVAKLCATCHRARARAAATAASYASDLLSRWRHSQLAVALYPRDGMPWSIELIHIHELIHRLHSNGWLIPFEFASDDIEASASNTCAEGTLDFIAATLRRHPRLRLAIEGHARPSAPAIFGRPLSQARATRVRQELLARLADAPAWRAEGEPSEGVRRPNGYTEGGDDFEDVASFYTQRVVGRRLRARGVWTDDDDGRSEYALRCCTRGSPGGQSAFVYCEGFDGPPGSAAGAMA